jgi:predicted RNase H-like HicB family nuclease
MKYTVNYALDEDGWWYTSIPAIQGCHTQGRDLAQAKERIRECLGLYVSAADARSAEFVDVIDLPKEIDDAAQKLKASFASKDLASIVMDAPI